MLLDDNNLHYMRYAAWELVKATTDTRRRILYINFYERHGKMIQSEGTFSLSTNFHFINTLKSDSFDFQKSPNLKEAKKIFEYSDSKQGIIDYSFLEWALENNISYSSIWWFVVDICGKTDLPTKSVINTLFNKYIMYFDESNNCVKFRFKSSGGTTNTNWFDDFVAAYVILAVSMTGHKEVLSIHIGENESAKYWLGVLNELKNRGVKDVLVICADGLTGMKEAVSAAFPQTELQRCIVHQVRNTLKYVGEKNKKEFANDLKTIYHAPSEDAALEALDRVTEKWEDDYPNAMKSWYKSWDVISPIFKFSSDVRKVIYTTNAIESLNSGYRRLNKQRSVFPSDTALLKALYLATHEIAKKWTMPLRNWGKVLGELEIMYPDRLG